LEFYKKKYFIIDENDVCSFCDFSIFVFYQQEFKYEMKQKIQVRIGVHEHTWHGENKNKNRLKDNR
jgi:hypothetical protein